MAPIVELFLPSAESGDPPLPWAERDGVAYSRRFPGRGGPSTELRREISDRKHSKDTSDRRHSEDISDRRHSDWRNPTPEMFEAYLSREAEQLIEFELGFLSGGG